jgi:inhibitor of cysteine peptidase
MGRTTALILALLFVTMGVISCTGQAKENLLVTEEDFDGLLVMEVGDILDVNLEGNPSTGYGWEMVQVAQPVLFQVGEIEFQSSSKLIGSPGRVTLHFEAVAAGEQILELIYRRPWEMDVPHQVVYRIEVQVK